MAIPIRDPADHDPNWPKRKKKNLPDHVWKVSQVLHFQLRHCVDSTKAPPAWELQAAIAVVRAMQGVASGKAATGGKKAGKRSKQAAQPKHTDWVQRARKLITNGRLPREVSSIIANGDKNRAKQIRTVLQDAGIVPRRKKRK